MIKMASPQKNFCQNAEKILAPRFWKTTFAFILEKTFEKFPAAKLFKKIEKKISLHENQHWV